jgi:hypothetical protein
MQRIIILLLLIAITLNSKSQASGKIDNKTVELTVGTFSTLTETGKLTVNPVFVAHWNDYYFENRYGYEAPNSASLNAGKKIFKKMKHMEIIPMVGLIFGSFKGLTAELQTSIGYDHWYFSTDNEYSYEYTKAKKSLYFNWSVARYKVTSFLHLGFTVFYDKRVDKNGVLDKGVTAAIIIKNWTLRLYAFNYEIERRYYSVGLRYTFKNVN